VSIAFEERPSDSTYIQSVTRGITLQDDATIRPAEVCWHLVILRAGGRVRSLLVGPWSSAGVTRYQAGGELLWIRFKLGAYLPFLPTHKFLNTEIPLPAATGSKFWLHSSSWQVPDFENVETFVDRLVRDGSLAFDPVVHTMLEGRTPDVSPRTVRHRFLHTAGLPYKHIQQYHRAWQAASLLSQGVPVLDVVFQLGYYDQPHLTRSLKRFLGFTPSYFSPA